MKPDARASRAAPRPAVGANDSGQLPDNGVPEDGMGAAVPAS